MKKLLPLLLIVALGACNREAGPGWRGSSHSATSDRLTTS